ncbi:hypothetical protein C1280_16410 [Gemmata obscuriglobus]|uniref:Uncharacterized protein n=1 Tax=Gemmata obscuriglobus TaxID=114 RepID=A0A2Z3H497_9BACT|nr:hypothetical protein C1280_16410 [Gemmata obscuriglobus]
MFGGNIFGDVLFLPHGWSSKPRGIRCLRCSACGKNFPEREGTPLFGLHMSDEKGLDIAHHLVEGNGMRPTGAGAGAPSTRCSGPPARPGTTPNGSTTRWSGTSVQPQQVQAD